MTANNGLTVVSGGDRIGARDTAPVEGALADVLADTHMLTFKTHGCRWNVEGPLFHSVQRLTERHYEDMFAATAGGADPRPGQLAPPSLAAIIEPSVVTDPESRLSAGEIVAGLAADHERVAHRLPARIEMAEAQRERHRRRGTPEVGLPREGRLDAAGDRG